MLRPQAEPDLNQEFPTSENKLKAILNDTSRKRIILNLTEITEVDIIRWHSEIRVIEDVEELKAELDLGSLSYPRILEDRHVRIEYSRSTERIAAKGAKENRLSGSIHYAAPKAGRSRKGGWIKD